MGRIAAHCWKVKEHWRVKEKGSVEAEATVSEAMERANIDAVATRLRKSKRCRKKTLTCA